MVSKVNDEFMRNVLIEEAWKNLSRSFEWNETLLEKHQKQVDWEEISSNSNIRWTIPMIRKFVNRLDWTKFSPDFVTQRSYILQLIDKQYLYLLRHLILGEAKEWISKDESRRVLSNVSNTILGGCDLILDRTFDRIGFNRMDGEVKVAINCFISHVNVSQLIHVSASWL